MALVPTTNEREQIRELLKAKLPYVDAGERAYQRQDETVLFLLHARVTSVGNNPKPDDERGQLVQKRLFVKQSHDL
ncbi:hypothetical protein BIW11_04532 [Tropilaelaps mercedesae]|uniref:Uncharacterized protein n=1 Tax=Tropilaelaps mercedesae TaxID=418985 RepID=A0A1V9X519_9ACAR|nr:hypothetical protein BIW11_04532 [Tropilaelaps mercedesae]